MSALRERPSLESVLDEFAVESESGRVVLERYLRLYPEYATELVDLSRELNCEAYEDTTPLSAVDQMMIDAAWSKHAAAAPTALADPFASLTVEAWRTVAQRLGVPRQVVTALRERRVSLASIPRLFLQRLAAAMNSSIPQLESAWGLTYPCEARSYKADCKPATGEQVTLEQVLIDAGVQAEERARLLAEVN